MCGRYLITSSPETMRRMFGYEEQPNFPPRYNAAPTQAVPVVRREGGKRHFALVRWGLIPSWVKDPKTFALLINARLEGITDKPSFRAAMRRRRCLVPADGFYEWQKAGKAKRPFCLRARAGEPVAFAGLWETWTDPDGGEIETMAIVTCAANRTLAPIHNRMPAIVLPEHYEAWLDADKVAPQEAAARLGPAPDELLEAYEISTGVNNVRNDGPELIVPMIA